MAKSEEELKSLLVKVKEESEKAGLKLSIQKMTWRERVGREVGGGSGWGRHVDPRPFHFNV